jgi:hypothetical protein
MYGLVRCVPGAGSAGTCRVWSQDAASADWTPEPRAATVATAAAAALRKRKREDSSATAGDSDASAAPGPQTALVDAPPGPCLEAGQTALGWRPRGLSPHFVASAPALVSFLRHRLLTRVAIDRKDAPDPVAAAALPAWVMLELDTRRPVRSVLEQLAQHLQLPLDRIALRQPGGEPCSMTCEAPMHAALDLDTSGERRHAELQLLCTKHTASQVGAAKRSVAGSWRVGLWREMCWNRSRPWTRTAGLLPLLAPGDSWQWASACLCFTWTNISSR